MAMRARARKAAETRWLYRVESTALKCNKQAVRQRSLGDLLKLAIKVWMAEAPTKRFPDIRFGPGVRHGTQMVSFCRGYTDIELAPDQRDYLVLLHEITHALGPCIHGPMFVRLYFRLLRQWAGYDWCLLQGIAAERNIVLD